MNSDYYEVPPNEILNQSKKSKLLASDPKLKELPLSEMPWEAFEELGLRLFNQIPKLKKLKAFRYGNLGQNQHGLDLIALDLESGKYKVGQCKRVKEVASSDLSNWVDRFLDGDIAPDSDEYILITSHPIRSTQLIDTWLRLQRKLHTRGIKSELWDYHDLLDRLRDDQATVEIFYGFEKSESFCLKSSGLINYPFSFPEKQILDLGWRKSLSNKSLNLDIFTPTESEPHLSAGFSFARSDLNGLSLAVQSKFLIELMQHRSHSKNIRDSKHLFESDDGKFLFALPYARLTLEPNEVDDLDWIIKEAWPIYYQSALNLEKKWKTIRFSRLETERHVYELCKVTQWFWDEIINYVSEFDFDNGKSDEYIFDSAGCLKVYVPSPRASLDPGYHLILYAHSDTSFRKSSDLVLGWQPLPNLSGESSEYSPRKAWDADFTHDWLVNDFFPKVYTNAIKKSEAVSRPFLDTPVRQIFKPFSSTKYRPIEEFYYSCASTKIRNLGLRVTTQKEARDVSIHLQSHFSVYLSGAPIEVNLIKNVIEICRFFLSTRSEYESHYVRSKLSLGNEGLYTELHHLEKVTLNEPRYPIDLDHALRALYSLTEDISDFSDADFSIFSELIQPIWNRYIEDTICGTFF